MDKIIKTLLKNRGIKTAKDVENFFNPPIPYNLLPSNVGIDAKQFTKGVARMIKAIEGKEKIIVYGDYDVDGISATAILWETLDFLKGNAKPYIPDRFSEGYGLNEESIKKLKEEDKELSLIVTVDHGIVASGKVDFAKELGIDVVISDHHLPGDTRPKAHAIIHTTQISGSAISWFLSRELIRQLKTDDQIPTTDHLGLAALGTVTDVLPLVGFNRSIVAHGLYELRETKRCGIISICEEAIVDQKELDTFHIGFIIGPRLNAAGRVEHAMDALRLICTRDSKRGKELARKLGQTNKVRQEKTEAMLAHVTEYFGPAWEEGSLPKLLFAHHESYDEGIVGIVAGRLVDKYHRPSIVLSIGEEKSKASARSVQGVSIVELIKKAGGDMLLSVGGHPMAAGFSIKTQDLDTLAAKLAEVALTDIKDESLVKNVRIDCKLDFNQINSAFYGELQKFHPFGYGNPEPTFETEGVMIEDARLVGKDSSHLKLTLSQNGLSFEAIGFRMGELYPKLKPDKQISIVYSIEQDEWNNKKRLQLKLRHINL